MNNLLRTNSTNDDFISLVKRLDQELAIRNGDQNAFYAQYNKVASINHVVVFYDNNIAAGCGAFKEFEKDAVEIKRMYVLPQYRGKGYALKILTELEQWALQEGYRACVLETGKKQPEAISLYQKAGYKSIPNYGQYTGVDNSVCMKKNL